MAGTMDVASLLQDIQSKQDWVLFKLNQGRKGVRETFETCLRNVYLR